MIYLINFELLKNLELTNDHLKVENLKKKLGFGDNHMMQQ
jgi:hypothetical protein